MTVFSGILRAHGIQTKTIVAYGEPALTNATYITPQAGANFYASQGFRIYPFQDMSDGYTSSVPVVNAAFKAAGGGMLGGCYGWGYATGFQFNAAAQFPDEQEYYLGSGASFASATIVGQTAITIVPPAGAIGFVGFSPGQAVTISSGSKMETNTIASVSGNNVTLQTGMLFAHAAGTGIYYAGQAWFVPATSYGIKGIVQDSPSYLGLWVSVYQAMDAGMGLQNLLGLSGWPQSDHGVNYAGAQGNNGGYNMKTLARYVNSGFYTPDVSTSGTHPLNGTPCFLWGLRGVNPNAFTGQTEVIATGVGNSTTYSGGVIPVPELGLDITNYHRAGRGGSFVNYYASASAPVIENTLLQMIRAKGNAFAITAVPYNFVANVPAYFASPIVLMQTGANGVFGLMQNTGGNVHGVEYFNYANSLDNSSNPGRSNFYEVAFPQTVLDFWLGHVPYYSHYDFLDVDTAINDMAAQTVNTAWTKYAAIYNKIPLGGWYGYEQDQLRVLTIDHYFTVPQTWSALGGICHQWGTDSYQSLAGWNLSQFKVILGLPNSQDATYAADLAQLTAAVNAGTNLILYRSAPPSLTGSPVPLTASHPIFAPYATADLNAGFPSGFGTISQIGAGKVIVLPQSYYGEGYSVGDNTPNSGTSDSLSSGLAWITDNAILWLGGLPTPAMWLPQYQKRLPWASPLTFNGQGGASGIGIHILGQKNGGKTILLSNSTTTAQTVNFNLDANFYGIPTTGYAFSEVTTGQMLTGSGSVINVNTALPPLSLLAFVSTTSQIPTTITVTAKPTQIR